MLRALARRTKLPLPAPAPRRMRVLLPHPSLLFYDQQLPQLSRRFSELELRPATPPTGACAGAGGALAPSGSASARRASQSPSSSRAGSADGSPQPPPALGGGEEPAAAPAAGRLGRLLSLGRRGGGRQQLGRLLRQHKTVPADEVRCTAWAVSCADGGRAASHSFCV